MAGNVVMADLLIKNGVNINTIDFTSKRLLTFLTHKEKMVEWLLSNGANLNVVDSEIGLSLLHLTAEKGKSIHRFKQMKL